jgi:hypothetical protein
MYQRMMEILDLNFIGLIKIAPLLLQTLIPMEIHNPILSMFIVIPYSLQRMMELLVGNYGVMIIVAIHFINWVK